MSKIFFNWSTGKDSALALYLLQKERKVSCLFTTINQHFQRVTMHGLSRELLEAQTEAIGLPLELVELPENCSMEDYSKLMTSALTTLQKEGYTQAAFGDIFLEDLKSYREKMLEQVGVEALFPLWKRDTRALLKEFIRMGFKAIVICIDASKLDASFLGRELDEVFLEDLPEEVDPCGENGEFHTFCYDGPNFKHAVSFDKGEQQYRSYTSVKKEGGDWGFWFLDLKLIK